MDETLVIPCPPFKLKLSSLDMRMPPLYSKRVLCFSLPNTDAERNKRIAHMLHAALCFTVQELPFLAGSVVRFSKQQPCLRDIRPQGAAYFETRDLSQEIKFSNLRKAHFSSSLLEDEKLCPLPKGIYKEDTIDVCRFRANFVEDGLLLVISVVHVVCDGRGITEILKIFTDKLRRFQRGELMNGSADLGKIPEHPYSLDRTSLVSGNGIPGAIENHSAWTTTPLKVEGSYADNRVQCTTFHITTDLLQRLQEEISLSGPSRSSIQGIDTTSHDAIMALIWRSIMIARHRAGIVTDQTRTHFGTFIDCRSRLQLPDPYFGNVVYSTATSLNLSDLKPSSHNTDTSDLSGLQAAAHAIRAEIRATTADKFRDLLGFIDRTNLHHTTRLTLLEDLSVASVIITSYFGFRMHELDFGEALGGTMEAFRLPAEGLAAGVPVIFPRLPDGSCEFVISEWEAVLEYLAEDGVFTRFARKLC